MMMAKGIPLTLIDSKPSQIELSGDFGMKVYYGDGTRIDLLRLAGAGEAKALLFCIDGPPLLSPRKLEPILEAFPQAAVFVRAFDRRHLIDLRTIDLNCVVREVFEIGGVDGARGARPVLRRLRGGGAGRGGISAPRRGTARHPGLVGRPPCAQGADVPPDNPLAEKEPG